MYSLANREYIKEIKGLDTPFSRQLFTLVRNSNKRGIAVVTDSTIDPAEGVINLCRLPKLKPEGEYSDLYEEISTERGLSLGYDLDFIELHRDILFNDYLLGSFLCYVEVYDGGKSKVDKFYATRNRFIAGYVAGVEETGKYISYLTPNKLDYDLDSLRVLKLSSGKSGYKITQPKSYLNFNRNVRVTPVFIVDSFANTLKELLSNDMCKITYKKDNGEKRELAVTLSENILLRYYDKDYVSGVLKTSGFKLDRGYIRLPELGSSKYDMSGIRAVNVTRILKVEGISTVDTRYINVDFNSIVPYFKGVIELVRDKTVLDIVSQTLLDKEGGGAGIVELRARILSYVDLRYSVGTTTFQRELHDYMLNYTELFKGYTGQPIKEAEESFNLGVEY